MKKVLLINVFLIFCITAVMSGGSSHNQEFVNTGSSLFRHSTFDDFSGGTLSNSGQNLFVSHDGQIRFINWFDLDNDGYPEIVVVNDHNPYETTDGFIYYNTPGRGFRSLMPPAHEFLPGFQQLEWMEASLKRMDRLSSLGGGTTLVSDLNGNGYPEIMFTNFVHGWSSNHFPVFIYWGGEDGFSRSRASYLPSLTASGLAAADLSGNGRKDIVMANAGREAFSLANASAYNKPEEGSSDRVVGAEEGTSYIYWQEVWGYSVENRSDLPTEYALDVSVADLDLDGYPDIVFLQGGVPGSIRIFYGGAGGVNAESYTDIEAIAPAWGTITRKMLVRDLNGNGRPDIFVPSHGDVSEIFWNGAEGFSRDNRTLIPSVNAMAGASEDLSGNGFNDLVVVNNHGDSWVYWGGLNGFSEDNRTALPSNVATGVEITDLNNNGYFDIIFSNSQKGESYDTPSYIYWGGEDGYHPADRDDLWGFGAVDVATGDFNQNGLQDIFLMNRQSGTRSPQYGRDTYNPTDLFILWGNERSRYSVASMTTLPGATAQSSALAADITGNGYADLVYTTDRGRVLNVFYGEKEGYNTENSHRFEIPFKGQTPLIADLNKNGFLDIVVAGDNTNEFAVLPGIKDGFEELQIFDFGISQFNSAIGDVDGNGNLDMVLGGRGFIKILFGKEQGFFDSSRTQTMKTDMFSTRISLADFNDNGLLDIFGHHHMPSHLGGEYSVYSAIYWNDKGTFSVDNRLELPSHGSHSGSVADVNKNGYPDILISNYNSHYKRNLETFIYWGGPGGSYENDRVTGLPGYSPVANTVLDLNGNGINDIVALNHSKSNRYAGLNPRGGMHGTRSYIYWGTEEGWHIGNRDDIPSIGPHGRLTAEPGDIMRRRSYEEYTSAPLQIGSSGGSHKLKVKSDHNFRQNIKLFIKSAANHDDLEKSTWQEIDLSDRTDEYFLYELSIGRGDSLMKYKLRLDTGGTGTGPVVRSVELFR